MVIIEKMKKNVEIVKKQCCQDEVEQKEMEEEAEVGEKLEKGDEMRCCRGE